MLYDDRLCVRGLRGAPELKSRDPGLRCGVEFGARPASPTVFLDGSSGDSRRLVGYVLQKTASWDFEWKRRHDED